MELEIKISRQTLKKTLGVLLVIALFFGICSPAAPYLPKVTFNASALGEVVTSGNCGHVTQGNAPYYTLYSDGTLEIFGKGEIKAEVFSYNCDIKDVIIYEGVTAIGAGAFNGCYNLENVIISDTVTSIGILNDLVNYSGVFEQCYNLKSVRFSTKLKELPKKTFDGCNNLVDVTILNPDCNISSKCGIRQDAIIYGYENSSADSFAYDNSSRFRIYCPHKNTENVAALEACCYTDGHYEGVKCLDCGRWVSGGETIFASHIDENGDNICDHCEKSMPTWDGIVGGNMENVNERQYCDDKARAYFYDDRTLEVFGEGVVRKSWPGGGNDSGYMGISTEAKELIIHEGITRIDSNCFKNFLYIEEVTVPSTVRHISYSAFAGCVRLSKIVVLNPECGFAPDGTSTPEKTVIYGYSGSAAEKYATDWLLKFVPLDKEHDHEFESKVTLKPTCTSTGVETFTCYCGESFTEVIVPNRHFDFTADGNCDACGTKLNAGGNDVAPDEGGTTAPPAEDGTAPEAPDNNDEPVVEEPEAGTSVFASFFESIINFFKNLMNIFNFFKQ